MPYLQCPRCGLSTFSAAGWSSIDHCARCGAELPRARLGDGGRDRPRSDTPSIADRSLDIEDAVRERLYGRRRGVRASAS